MDPTTTPTLDYNDPAVKAGELAGRLLPACCCFIVIVVLIAVLVILLRRRKDREQRRQMGHY
ncbi:hypothetical protein [Dactylosporangium matsuzakiense]|uniref:Uncharacterized protein n=1 Tax=Dactylosporangium matsuzakiense TaxID=53360 RepID=A0A9W6NP08_9ACTN|nr:hypothetical protein [Dactylosporangium matsuzakiense]UWZ42694.1 hypothetical protein Dmats_34915 [Dactylosporangium matsuzakiense]GLL03823.1 hypothetical protein GCM10017581_055690 [Dactylosporangium matsuzakiense]